MDIHEKQKKGGMYVYKFDTGNMKMESDPKKKAVWGLRKSKTYRENKSDGVEGGGLEMAEARKSVSNDIVGARKSILSNDIGARKSVSHVEMNVASITSFLQVKVLVTDMPGFMQVHAFRCARRTYDSLEKFSSKHMAYNMKKEFDKVYGPAWHCIVGSSFGSFVTHSTGCFLYFSMEKLHILVFKTKVQKALE